ncbi:hypothetical protein P8452_00679 [Trifolium repens]|nr:hypothetical protein P8452_00679 [Trifolium repens]
MSLITIIFGTISFLLGIVGENKKPMICNYPNDPTVIFGYSSIGFLVASSLMGLLSFDYQYIGWGNDIMATMTEQHHWRHNLYSANVTTSTKLDCPTAKTGLMGGGAFLCLISSLFWLLSLMLVKNAREDYLEEDVPPNV